MKVLMDKVFKGYTFICTSKTDTQLRSVLHEKNVFLVQVADEIFVKVDDLISNPGRFKDIIYRLPRYTTKPTRAGEIYVDRHCIQPVFENCEVNEKIDVKYIQQTEITAEI